MALLTGAREVKWFAGLGMVGAIFTIVMLVLRLTLPDSRLGGYFDLAGSLLLVFVLIAIYLVHKKNSGTYGLITFILSLIGTSLYIGVKWVHSFVVPELMIHASAFYEEPPVAIIAGQMGSFAIFMIGWILVGILVIKKGYLSKISGILLIVAPILDFLPFAAVVAQPLFALTILWVSYQLYKGKGAENLQET